MLAEGDLINPADFPISVQDRINGKVNRIGADVVNNFEPRIAAASNFVDCHGFVLGKGEQ